MQHPRSLPTYLNLDAVARYAGVPRDTLYRRLHKRGGTAKVGNDARVISSELKTIDPKVYQAVLMGWQVDGDRTLSDYEPALASAAS